MLSNHLILCYDLLLLSSVFPSIREAEVDVFLEFPWFLHDPTNAGNLISGSSAFLKTNLNIWNFIVHVLLKAGLENFEHYFASVWDECNCVVVWTFLALPFLGLEWKLTFSSPVATAEFSKFAGILSAILPQHFEISHHFSGFEIVNWNSITSTSFVRSDAS